MYFDKYDKRKKRVPVKATPYNQREISDGIPSMEPSYGVAVEEKHLRGYSHP